MSRSKKTSRATPRSHLALAAIALAALSVGPAVAQSASVTGSEELARVNGETITMNELLHHLGVMHEGMGPAPNVVEAPDPMSLLQRLINVRLVVQEARNIGLAELPEIAGQLEAGRRDLIKRAVIDEQVKDIESADPEQVERLYRDAVREVEVTSVLFPTREAAETFLLSIADGADFDFLAEKMVQAGNASQREEAQSLKAGKLLPQISRALSELEPGGVTPPIQVGGSYTVVKLLEVRFPQDPEARAQAEGQALTVQRELALAEYSQELRERYAAPDRELIESLDYDSSKPGLEALKADQRVLVEIRGGEPISVADLTERIADKFFHGIEHAIERQRVNDEVLGVVDRLILERAVALEAKRLGVEQRATFQSALKAQQGGLIFGTFVSRVINPKVAIENEELEAYYAEHRAEFTTPQMVRIENLVFARREDATAALARLRRGSDMRWMRDRAEGQVDPSAANAGWRFAGTLLALAALPDEVQAVLEGAATGDYRLCEQPDGPFHVLRVIESLAPQPRSFDEVRKEIAGKVFARKRQAILEEWMGKLREASEVEMLVDEKGLRDLLGVAT